MEERLSKHDITGVDAHAWLNAILRLASDGIALFDEDGKAVAWNSIFERITGMTHSMIHQRFFWDIAFDLMPLEKRTPDAYEMLKASQRLLWNEDGVQYLQIFDLTIRRVDGTTAEIRQIPFPVPLDRGYGMLLFLKDVSEEKQAEREIRASRNFLQIVIEESHDGIMLVDTAGTIVSANSAAERLFGVTRQELVGRRTSELVMNEPDMHKQVRQAMKECFEKGYATYETMHRTKDGKVVVLENTATLLRDAQGDYIGGIAILRDVSERKRAEQHLSQVQKMEALGTLAGGIAHDFNNILAAIMGYAELSLNRLEQAHPVRKNLERILQSTMRARDLVKQILTFSRASESERRPVLLENVINDAVKLLRASIPVTIEIRQNIQAHGAVIIANPIQIEQVIMNLGANAGQAMMETGGALDIGLFRTLITDVTTTGFHDIGPGPYYELTVKDTGPGIDKAIQHRIFDPFFTTKEIGKGTGMGLAVVLGIVKSHGGTVLVESEPGKGALFRVLLPAADTEEPACDSDTEPLTGGRERILFVDDEELIVESCCAMLETLGYTVTGVCGSAEALQVFERNPLNYDLVIADQTMPKMTGFELAQRLFSVRSDIPVVLCTGFSETVSEEAAKKAGIREFIMKPINQRELAFVVRKALGH